MGIVNVTPDSFSDGGQFADADAAVAHALRLVSEGADIVDVGGESTRPGARPVDADEEADRVLPVIRAVRARFEGPISIDTRKAEIARGAVEAGADIVNDVSALSADPRMADVARESGAGVVLMHMRGTPETMQERPEYDRVVEDVAAYLTQRMRALSDAGLDPENLCVDPGIGFGKTLEHNLALLRGIPQLSRLDRPVMIGLSRKSFLGALTGREVDERVAANLAAMSYCVMKGAHVMRVHDVKASVDARRVLMALAAKGD